MTASIRGHYHHFSFGGSRLAFSKSSRVLIGLILLVVWKIGASGTIPARENISTQPMTSNGIRESKDLNESTPFYEALAKALKKRKIKLDNICPSSDPVSRRILEEYGAIFVADKKVTPPPVCVFTNEEQVTRFQDDAGFDVERFGFDDVVLQPEAMKKLK